MAGELNKSVEANKLISAPKPIKSSGSIKSSTVDALKVTEPQQAKIPETLPGTSQANTTPQNSNEVRQAVAAIVQDLSKSDTAWTQTASAKLKETVTTRSENEKAYQDEINVMWVFATNARVAEFSNVS
jgi:hypothetical protein